MNKLWNKNKIFSNFSHLLGENFLRMVIGIFTSTWLARSLGAEDFGIFTYVISLVVIFSPLYTFGSDESIVVEMVGSKKSLNSVMGSALFLRLIGGMISITIITLIGWSLKGDVKYFNVCLGFYSFAMLFKSLDFINNFYQSKLDLKPVVKIRNIVFIVISVLKIILLIFEKEWTYFIFLSGLEIILVGLGYFFILFKKTQSKLEVKSKEMKSILSRSLPMIIILFLFALINRIDQLMISHYVGDIELGLYAVAVKLVELWQFLPLSILLTVLPGLVDAKSNRDQSYMNKVYIVYGIIGWGALLFATSVNFISDFLIINLYGIEFSEAGKILGLYSWLNVFIFFHLVRDRIFLIEKKMKTIIKLFLLILVLNIVFNYFLIQSFQSLGAILGSCLAYLIGNLIFSMCSRDIRESVLMFMKSFFISLKILLSNLREVKKDS